MKFYEIFDEQGRFRGLEATLENSSMGQKIVPSAGLVLGLYKLKDYCIIKEFGNCEENCLGLDKKCQDYMNESDFDAIGNL